MPHSMHINLLRRAMAGLCLVALGGCSAVDRLKQVGETPHLTEIQNPNKSPSYRPVSLPMPVIDPIVPQANSLWRPGARAFFKDQRAAQVGDILTVLIDIADKAKLSNSSDRTRTTSENDTLPSLLGLEENIRKIMPKGFSTANPVDISGSTQNKGTGTINRDETISLKVAAVVTQVLPNGNLVLKGSQEVRVNFEVRELQVTGVVRREDIASTNTISYEKIAEARIAYGGRGHITDVQQPRYGTQVLDIIYPF